MASKSARCDSSIHGDHSRDPSVVAAIKVDEFVPSKVTARVSTIGSKLGTVESKHVVVRDARIGDDKVCILQNPNDRRVASRNDGSKEVAAARVFGSMHDETKGSHLDAVVSANVEGIVPSHNDVAGRVDERMYGAARVSTCYETRVQGAARVSGEMTGAVSSDVHEGFNKEYTHDVPSGSSSVNVQIPSSGHLSLVDDVVDHGAAVGALVLYQGASDFKCSVLEEGEVQVSRSPSVKHGIVSSPHSVQSWVDQVAAEDAYGPTEGNGSLKAGCTSHSPKFSSPVNKWASIVKGKGDAVMKLSYIKPPSPLEGDKIKIKPPSSVVKKGISHWQNTLVGFFLDKLPFSFVQKGAQKL